MKYKTRQDAEIAAAKNQAKETNTAGWWKYRETADGWIVYFDSAKQRIGAADGYPADPAILNTLG